MIRLVPEGVVYGRVSGEDGEALEGLQVQLLEQRVVNGRSQRVAGEGTVTDDEGRFRLADLHPGKYFLLAGPENFSELANGFSSSTFSQYGAMYYPGVADFSAATEIEITAGRHAETNFKLARQPLYQVSGRVNGYPPGGTVALVVVSATGQGVGNYQVDQSTGAFEMSNVPSSGKRIVALCMDQTGTTYFGTASLQLSSNMTNLRITLRPAADVLANVRKEVTHDEGRPGNGEASRLAVFTAGSYLGAAFLTLTPEEESLAPATYSSQATGVNDDSALVVKQVFPWEVSRGNCGERRLLRGLGKIRRGGRAGGRSHCPLRAQHRRPWRLCCVTTARH